jgi:hypothetical protein
MALDYIIDVLNTLKTYKSHKIHHARLCLIMSVCYGKCIHVTAVVSVSVINWDCKNCRKNQDQFLM